MRNYHTHSHTCRSTISHWQFQRHPRTWCQASKHPKEQANLSLHLHFCWSIALCFWTFRLVKATNDIFQSCSLGQQDIAHLFDCPARPTTQRTIDLGGALPISLRHFLILQTYFPLDMLHRPLLPSPHVCHCALLILLSSFLFTVEQKILWFDFIH